MWLILIERDGAVGYRFIMSITRSFLEPKELLMFFPQNFSCMKVSKNKILGTAQKLTDTKENIWVDVDIGKPAQSHGVDL